MRRLSILAVALVFLPLAATLGSGCAKRSTEAPDGTLGTATDGGPSWAKVSGGEGARASSSTASDSWSSGSAAGSAADEASPSDSRSARGPRPSSSPPSPDWDGGGWREEAEFHDDHIAGEQPTPGLGTSYGESRRSSIETVGFRRAEPSTPDVVFTVRYDDVDGVRSAARTKRARAWSDDAMQQHAGLSFALLDDRGQVLPAAAVNNELWAVGQPEARYSLAIANDTGSAFEVVASVDGLDIIDGRPAGFGKRGYIVDPFSSVVIDGWRTSEDTVAAFRFSSIEDSYAERTGEGRNVGVIGAAFFRQAPEAWDEWRPAEETWRRDSADPFPGR